MSVKGNITQPLGEGDRVLCCVVPTVPSSTMLTVLGSRRGDCGAVNPQFLPFLEADLAL